jgi:hypothetical protein
MKRRSARRKKLDAVRQDLCLEKFRVSLIEKTRTELQVKLREKDEVIDTLRKEISEISGVTTKFSMSGRAFKCNFLTDEFIWSSSPPAVQRQIVLSWANRIEREMNRLLAEK